jgi:hypothetical protein
MIIYLLIIIFKDNNERRQQKRPFAGIGTREIGKVKEFRL